jgi:glyoxylase-like metal-dependent hydrolase (beta-lactamase superfamily II)
LNHIANELEKQLHYPLGDLMPGQGKTLEVVPGVKWIRMALPFALNHINLWLLRDEIDGRSGWSVVDCCIHSEVAKAQWAQIFENELEGLPIVRVIVTHMHPDHIGLANWLCERWQVRLWMSATDYTMARIGTEGPTGFGGDSAADFFALHGLNDPVSVAQIKGRGSYYPTLVPSVPQQYRRMMAGDVLTIGGQEWRCISGYGHAPEHISLACEALKVLIGGDMMLPRISTNVSVYDMEPEANSLRHFLDSIDQFKTLDAQTLTLPSHGKPFTGLHARIGQLHDHHRDRLAEVLEACMLVPGSAADMLPVLFKRTLDLHQTTFAMGESIAHLHLLWYAGQLTRTLGADGVYRFGAPKTSEAPTPL